MRDWRVNSLSEIEWIIILEDFRDSLPARFSLVRKYTVLIFIPRCIHIDLEAKLSVAFLIPVCLTDGEKIKYR